jgi:hypothetical protein
MAGELRDLAGLSEPTKKLLETVAAGIGGAIRADKKSPEIRLISARKATGAERRRYEAGL